MTIRRLKEVRAWVLTALVTVLLPVLASGGQAVSSDEMRRRLLNGATDVVLIDVRAPGDYALGHIQGAENVPLGDIGSWQPPASKNVVLYCPGSSCEASSAASKALSDRGYSNVQVLDGGLAAWQKAGYPVARKEALPVVLRPSVGRLSAREAKVLGAAGKLFIVDARPFAEFRAGHLPGAVNIPLEELGTSLTRVPAGRQVLVYDRLSSRSREAAEKLISAGYAVKELTGGIAGWVKAKYALEVK